MWQYSTVNVAFVAAPFSYFMILYTGTAYVVGTDRWRKHNKGLITDVLLISLRCGGAFVVYVSFDQSFYLFIPIISPWPR